MHVSDARAQTDNHNSLAEIRRHHRRGQFGQHRIETREPRRSAEGHRKLVRASRERRVVQHPSDGARDGIRRTRELGVEHELVDVHVAVLGRRRRPVVAHRCFTPSEAV